MIFNSIYLVITTLTTYNSARIFVSGAVHLEYSEASDSQVKASEFDRSTFKAGYLEKIPVQLVKCVSDNLLMNIQFNTRDCVLDSLIYVKN